MTLQGMGIIPDRVIHLNTPDHVMMKSLKERFTIDHPNMSEDEMSEKIGHVIHEYKVNIAKVREVFKDFMFELNVGDQHQL